MRERRKGKGNQNSERFASSSCFVFENEMIISTRLNGCISHSEQWKFKIQNFDFFSYFTFFFSQRLNAVLGLCFVDLDFRGYE